MSLELYKTLSTPSLEYYNCSKEMIPRSGIISRGSAIIQHSGSQQALNGLILFETTRLKVTRGREAHTTAEDSLTACQISRSIFAFEIGTGRLLEENIIWEGNIWNNLHQVDHAGLCILYGIIFINYEYALISLLAVNI